MAIINSSIFSFLSCFIFMLLAISTNQSLANPPRPFEYTLCSYEKGNFTDPSIYSTNLNGLLSSLPFDAGNASGFYSWSYGENSDKVYATGVCRGDVKPDSCTACLSDAQYFLKEACSNQKEATIWLDEKCMLRYSNGSIYGVVQVLPIFYKWKSENASRLDVDWFNQQLVMLLGRLTSEAAAGGDVQKFATGNASSPDTTSHHQTIYALVQCTPDLSEPECSSCLVSALGDVQFYGYRKEGGTVITPSCNLKYDVYPFFVSTIYEAPSPLPVPPFFSSPPSTTTKNKRGKKSNRHRTAIIIIVVLIVVSMLLILSNICIYLRGRKAKKILEDLQMDFDEIRSATDDFSDTNKLGEGGFGVVYKGILKPNGEEIAVKRLSTQSGQGELEFNNELVTLAKLQHRNLVKLRGFCVEKRERLLVYEFVRNGSLDRYIFEIQTRAPN